MEPTFADAFQDRIWSAGDTETVSGPGSTLRYTERLRAMLPALLAALGCRSMLDAPCGDYNWMRAVPLCGIAYEGGDIVAEMIAALQARYPDVRFRRLDITADPLPAADLWLCRDVLLHLSDNAISAVLANFRRSTIRYFGTTHYADRAEFAAYFGAGASRPNAASGPMTFRYVNLTEQPFHWPAPEFLLPDYVPGFPRRWLAVWDKERL